MIRSVNTTQSVKTVPCLSQKNVYHHNKWPGKIIVLSKGGAKGSHTPR